jgi:hypothetical protein
VCVVYMHCVCASCVHVCVVCRVVSCVSYMCHMCVCNTNVHTWLRGINSLLTGMMAVLLGITRNRPAPSREPLRASACNVWWGVFGGRALGFNSPFRLCVKPLNLPPPKKACPVISSCLARRGTQEAAKWVHIKCGVHALKMQRTVMLLCCMCRQVHTHTHCDVVMLHVQAGAHTHTL